MFHYHCTALPSAEGWTQALLRSRQSFFQLSYPGLDPGTLKLHFVLFYVYGCSPAHISMYPWRLEEGIGSSGTGVTGDCKPPCWCWGLNSGLLQEQQVFWTNWEIIQNICCCFFNSEQCTTTLLCVFLSPRSASTVYFYFILPACSTVMNKQTLKQAPSQKWIPQKTFCNMLTHKHVWKLL